MHRESQVQQRVQSSSETANGGDSGNGEERTRRVPSVGVPAKPKRRRFSAEFKARIVEEADVERERTQQIARIGNNLNQIARWANAHKGAIEAVEVIGHIIAIERGLAALTPAEDQDGDAD